MLKIIEKTKLWFAISLTIIFIGIVFLFINHGFDFGIEFKGGTVVEINMGKSYTETQKNTDLNTIIKKYDPDAMVTISSDPNTPDSIMLQIKGNSEKLTTDNNDALFKELQAKYKLDSKALISQESIGATVGNELRNKAVVAIIISTICILIYIGIRFEFRFALAAIIALIHDVLITLAVYSVFKIPIDLGFIAAMLTVIGYSVSDTIVVFDRIRENQNYLRKVNVSELANASITQTFIRSIYTVMTVLIALVSVFIFVPSIRNFTTPLIVGIVSGCYSSIFIASPIWVIFKNIQKKNKLKARANLK